MASQHPDQAGKPYWHSGEFISAAEELEECYLAFSELGVSEYKWDWEGKFVDEAVIERLFSQYYDFFKKYPLGKEKFLTFRLPNPKVETEFRLGRAFMGILTSASLAESLKLHNPPLFEVILPMTETAEEMIHLQEAFRELSGLKHKIYNFNGILPSIEVIPLFEQAETIAESHKIIEKYLAIHQKKFGDTPLYLRPYCARSDPALNSGIVATILAIKIAFSEYGKFERERNIKLYPIVGTGSLPFRGGLSPDTVGNFLQEYQGIRTALLQSAFRYDYPQEEVKKAVLELEKNLPQSSPLIFPEIEIKQAKEAISVFEKHYRETIEGIAPVINTIAPHVPRRRERVLHTGLFGYNRGVGKVTLPRAITFTASLYSLGIPPELIGTGRGLQEAKEKGYLDIVEKFYVNLKSDLLKSGYFLNKEVLNKLARTSSIWENIVEDVTLIEQYLGVELGPKTDEQLEHQARTSFLYSLLGNKGNLEPEIVKTGILRKSLG